MKISISTFCWHCFKETSQSEEDYEKLRKELHSDIDLKIEINEENLYEYTCPKGHKTFTSLQAQKFEILFDLASMALLDGYTREAVSGFSSAFERFCEYYIQIISLKNNILQTKFIKTWKLIHKQSERQLGAFFILRMIENKEIVWDEKKVEFRNKVIHQGYIPKIEESIEYGDYILRTIILILKELKVDSMEYLQKATFYHLTKNGNLMSKKIPISTLATSTIINLLSIMSDSFGNITLKEALTNMKGNGFYTHFYQKGI